MKKLYSFIVITFTCFLLHANAQTPYWKWAKGFGGTGIDAGRSIVVDGSDNVYTTGQFSGTCDFDPGAGIYNMTSAGANDIFISKLDASGNFIWAKRMGGTDEDAGLSIIFDSNGSGSIYTTGYFNGSVDFDPGTGTSLLISIGVGDVFISKLDTAGNFIWAKSFGGTNDDSGNSIAVDAFGNSYTCGNFMANADFDPGAGLDTITSIGVNDVFISKFDSAGNFIWVSVMGGASNDIGTSIAVDHIGNSIYTTGGHMPNGDFDPGPGIFNLTGVGAFISKLDSGGNFIWAKELNGLSAGDKFSIALEPIRNLEFYFTGPFANPIDFDLGPDTFTVTAAGVYDVGIAKYDSAGNFIWAKAIGGLDQDYSYGIAIDPTGNGDVYTTGFFYDLADFDPGAGIFNLTPAGSSDMFISKLDSAGNFGWAKSAGGIGFERADAITFSSSGDLHATGSFTSTPSIFVPYTFSALGITDIFIATLDSVLITGNEAVIFENNILVYPNPFSNTTTISFTYSKTGNVSLKIFDINGRLIKEFSSEEITGGEFHFVWEAGDIQTGIYFLQLQTKENLATRKVIVSR